MVSRSKRVVGFAALISTTVRPAEKFLYTLNKIDFHLRLICRNLESPTKISWHCLTDYVDYAVETTKQSYAMNLLVEYKQVFVSYTYKNAGRNYSHMSKCSI